MTASLIAYIQQTELQYSLPPFLVISLEPAHWIQATFFGALRSEGLRRFPWKGPDALRIRSNWMLEITLENRPYP
jgi:hypothetical protein